MCFNPSPERRVPSPNRYMAFARFCFCKNNKRTIIMVPRGPPTHASAGPWGAWIVGTSLHLLQSSDSLKEYEDAGPWGVWLLGGLNNTPRLAPAEHCTVGGSKRTLGRIPPRGVGLSWLTTGPSRVRGDGSTLWVFWNKSALRADLRVFLSVGCRGEREREREREVSIF